MLTSLSAPSVQWLEWLMEMQLAHSAGDLPLGQFMTRVTDRLVEFTPADGAVIEMVEGEDLLYAAADQAHLALVGMRLKLASSLSGLCVAARTAQVSADAWNDPRTDAAACRKVGLRSMICVPLMARGEAVGVLKAFSSELDRFSEDDRHFLETVGKSLSVALAATMLLERLESEVAQKEAHAGLIETAFSDAPIGIALVSLGGAFLQVNPSFCALTARAPDDLLRLDFQAITHPDDLDADLHLLAQLLAGAIPNYQMDKRYIGPDGRVVWASLSVSLVRDKSGAPLHFIAQVTDLTRRMEAEARYQLIADNTTDMIVTSTIDGRVLSVSAACSRITGWQASAAIGATPDVFIHEDDRPAVHEAFTRARAGESGVRVRWRGLHADGRLLWLESSPSWVEDSSSAYFVDVVRDVTEQVSKDQALARALEAAEAATRAKSDFLANMSHEIRTPLTAVIGFSGLLQARPDLAPQAKHFADRIGVASRALLALVNDILDFSKLEAGEVEIQPRPTDVPQLAAEVLSLFQPQAQTRSIALAVHGADETPPTLVVDPQALRQVLTNLVGNAVKFTERGEISLTLRCGDGRLLFEVADTGPGLSEADQAKLFQRFSQVDGSASRRHGGTGLGLAICRGLVHAMGGEIGVRSQPGQGSTFWFFVPTSVAALSPEAAGQPVRPALEGVRVLVVDDNPVNREMARAMLDAVAAQVTLAADGEAALAAAAAHPVDVVLMDIRMPGLGGEATLERLRGAAGPNRRTPVVAFTAGADEFDAARFDGVLNKPLIAADLYQAVSRALAPQEQRRAALG